MKKDAKRGKGRFKRMVRLFHFRRIRKTQEQVSYWRAKGDTWRQLCAGCHMSYERDYLVEAFAQQRKYEARLESLLSNVRGESPVSPPQAGHW